ncbi:MAG: sigma-70 family RNA polymerase sigma factor [Saprospiraceae bacterium]|nr:sigma-70 family RNA polymerase sigma factor [Saprospiraceae bacterium]
MSKEYAEIPDDQQLLQALQSKESKALEQLYLSYRKPFIAFARRYQANEEDVLDAYQDAVIAFFENVQTGKLNKLSSTIKTYLFSIGKYKLINKLKQNGSKSLIDYTSDIEAPQANFIDDKLELSHRQKTLKAAINELGNTCRELLLLFYYKQYSIEAIQIEMGFKNENTVKANKSRCMKNLKSIIQKKDIL